MKNYLLEQESEVAKTFILNYEVDWERYQLVLNVFLANGGKQVIPYSVENEKKILAVMKEQVLRSNVSRVKCRRGICLVATLVGFFGGLFMGLGCLAVMGKLIFNMLLLLMMVVSGVVVYNGIKEIKELYTVIKDIDKHNLFLANEERLNKAVETNQEVLNNIDDMTRDTIGFSLLYNSPVFSLHSMDEISYEDLKTVIRNVESYEANGYVYSEVATKRKILQRRRGK